MQNETAARLREQVAKTAAEQQRLGVVVPSVNPERLAMLAGNPPPVLAARLPQPQLPNMSHGAAGLLWSGILCVQYQCFLGADRLRVGDGVHDGRCCHRHVAPHGPPTCHGDDDGSGCAATATATATAGSSTAVTCQDRARYGSHVHCIPCCNCAGIRASASVRNPCSAVGSCPGSSGRRHAKSRGRKGRTGRKSCGSRSSGSSAAHQAGQPGPQEGRRARCGGRTGIGGSTKVGGQGCHRRSRGSRGSSVGRGKLCSGCSSDRCQERQTVLSFSPFSLPYASLSSLSFPRSSSFKSLSSFLFWCLPQILVLLVLLFFAPSLFPFAFPLSFPFAFPFPFTAQTTQSVALQEPAGGSRGQSQKQSSQQKPFAVALTLALCQFVSQQRGTRQGQSQR
jgi:hypothetical protein